MQRQTFYALILACVIAAMVPTTAWAVDDLTLIPNKTCFTTTGEVITFDVKVSNLSGPIVGAQFFLRYTDPKSCWNVDTVVPVAPFDQMYQNKNLDTGDIDYAVHVAPTIPGVNQDAILARVTMKWAAGASGQGCCQPTLGFRPHSPPAGLTNAAGAQITPTLGPAIQVFLDSQVPVITLCAPDQTLPTTLGTCTAQVVIGAPEATDNCKICSVVGVRSDGGLITDPTYLLGVTTILWTVTDCCGNATVCTQTITVLDKESPKITCPSSPIIVPADAKCQALLPNIVSHASATDNCDPLPDIIQLQEPGQVLPLGDTPVAVCAIDDSGNRACCDIVVSVVDQTSPIFTVCPQDILVPADAGKCTAVVEWIVAAQDNCDGAMDIVCTAPSGTAFPQGVTPISCATQDQAGNVATCSFNITVMPMNVLVADVELQAQVKPGPFARNITFEVANCETGASATVPSVMVFVGGTAHAEVLIPCGEWTCIAARDRLHTVRRLGSIAVDGIKYKTQFIGSKALLGGNFNDDGWIDIFDFGLFYGQFGKCYGIGCPAVADPNCNAATPAPHCDVNGEGRTNALDFTFIHLNFFAGGDALCCTTPRPSQLIAKAGGAPWDAPAPGPRSSVAVSELKALGLSDMAAADVNKDGRIDRKDIALFLMKGATSK